MYYNPNLSTKPWNRGKKSVFFFYFKIVRIQKPVNNIARKFKILLKYSAI